MCRFKLLVMNRSRSYVSKYSNQVGGLLLSVKNLNYSLEEGRFVTLFARCFCFEYAVSGSNLLNK